MPPLVSENETGQHTWISALIKIEKPIPREFIIVSVVLYNYDHSLYFPITGLTQGFNIYHNPEFIGFEEGNRIRPFRTYFPNNRYMEVKVRCVIMTQF